MHIFSIFAASFIYTMERNKNRSTSKPRQVGKRERIVRKDNPYQNQHKEEKVQPKDGLITSNKIVLKKKEPFKKFDERPGDRNQYSNFSLPRRERPYRANVLDLNEIKQKAAQAPDDGLIRLNKYIANAGICSRREADQLIESGAVTVNGVIVTQLGTKVSPTDTIAYGGETLSGEKKVYVLLNKPKGYITTADDPQDRKTVMTLIQDACRERIYPVGRLDRNTSGLLLFTNDGEIAKKLTHPRYGAKKLYNVELDRALTRADMEKIITGVELEDGIAIVDEIAYNGDGQDKKSIGLLIHLGKNRIVRRIFESLGYDVVKLDRVMFAGLTKKDLPRGHWRFLNEKELSFLKMLRS